jgi:hypothetical protein
MKQLSIHWNRFWHSPAAGVVTVLLWCAGIVFFLAEITGC